MAITFIYPIKSTGEKSLNYDTENKSAVIVDEKKNDSKDSLDYVMRDKKGNAYRLSSEYLDKMKNYISRDGDGNIIFHTITTSMNCCVKTAYIEWEMARKTANISRKGNLQYCIVQNFGVDINPMTANEIGVKFAQRYLAEYQCVVSTHINTGFVHNHIEFNATSFVTGKKFNDNLKAIGDIRKISDELCRQYELEVLEHTKDFNYVLYKDAEGRTKVYEPTERKNKITEGEFSDKNDYRNTGQYKQSMFYDESHIEILRKDIERFLPLSQSYEELLQQLKNAGYEIKDKTKDGSWRKHISFKAASWEKYTRDSSLGENYERDTLIRIIEDNVKSGRTKTESIQQEELFINEEKNSDKIYTRYENQIYNIDEEFRYKKRKNKNERVQRSEVEKHIISDTKRLNKELDSMVKHSMYLKRERIQELAGGSKKEQYLIDRINSNLRTLHFVEEKELRSFEQINETVKSLYEKRNSCQAQLSLIADALKKANENIVLMEKYSLLKDSIGNNSKNKDYEIYEKKNDENLLKEYEEALRHRNLLSQEEQREYKEKYKKYNTSFSKLVQALERVNADIKDYDDCIFNLNVVDRDNGNRYEKQIETYYSTKKHYKYSGAKENNRNER